MVEKEYWVVCGNTRSRLRRYVPKESCSICKSKDWSQWKACEDLKLTEEYRLEEMKYRRLMRLNSKKQW